MGWYQDRKEAKAEDAAVDADLKGWAESGYGRNSSKAEVWVAWSAPEPAEDTDQ